MDAFSVHSRIMTVVCAVVVLFSDSCCALLLRVGRRSALPSLAHSNVSQYVIQKYHEFQYHILVLMYEWQISMRRREGSDFLVNILHVLTHDNTLFLDVAVDIDAAVVEIAAVVVDFVVLLVVIILVVVLVAHDDVDAIVVPQR
jgi:hypothetical protein